MKKLQKKDLPRFLAELKKQATVYVPVDNDGLTQFAVWEEGTEPALDKNTIISPKKIFFPQTEELYAYETKKLQAAVQELDGVGGPTVVVGIRPCDVKAIELLDDVFLAKGFEDIYYKKKREETVLVSLGCLQPEPSCFCSSWGIDPGRAPQADIMMADTGDAFLLSAQSEKGEKLLQATQSLLADTSQEFPEGKECSLQVEVEGLTEKLQKMFEHPVWGEICRKCINCGTCTYLCPTCHCFDILNRNRGEKGVKYRCYDSCMYKEYTLMAGGHNPRPTKKERVRQRFLHKLQYMPERYEKWGCVGCGRCLVKCPVTLDITRVINQLREVPIHD